jgi:hypothetical protein
VDRKEGSASFLKKRSKKLLSVKVLGPARGEANEQSFFASFFSKKEALAYLPSASARPGAP